MLERDKYMELKEILAHVDHTLLAQTSTAEQIEALCRDAVKYGTASVCVPASYVAQAARYFKAQEGRTPAVCTVIGFPNGYDTTICKCVQARDAIANGADEIDMVINIGWAKDHRWDELLDEIRAVREACGDKILKVIIETCMLDDEEKVELCRIVSRSGADYITTSTGVGGGGATFHDVELFAANIAPSLKIKAAGGISSIEDAEKFIALGADRLGTSRLVKIAKEKEK